MFGDRLANLNVFTETIVTWNQLQINSTRIKWSGFSFYYSYLWQNFNCQRNNLNNKKTRKTKTKKTNSHNMQREHTAVQGPERLTWTSFGTHAKQSCHTLSISVMMLTRTGFATSSFRFSAVQLVDSSVVCAHCPQWPHTMDRCSSRGWGKSPSRWRPSDGESGKSEQSLHFCSRSHRTCWHCCCCCRCQKGCSMSSFAQSCFRCCCFQWKLWSPWAARFGCGPMVPQLVLGCPVPASLWAADPDSSSRATCQRNPDPWAQPDAGPDRRPRLDHVLKPLFGKCGSPQLRLLFIVDSDWLEGNNVSFKMINVWHCGTRLSGLHVPVQVCPLEERTHKHDLLSWAPGIVLTLYQLNSLASSCLPLMSGSGRRWQFKEKKGSS